MTAKRLIKMLELMDPDEEVLFELDRNREMDIVRGLMLNDEEDCDDLYISEVSFISDTEAMICLSSRHLSSIQQFEKYFKCLHPESFHHSEYT